MGFLLDTSTLSRHLRGDRRVMQRVGQHGGRLYVSAVVLAEISVWPRLRRAKASQAEVDQLLAVMHLLPVDEPVALRFAAVAADLRNAGNPLPTPDLLIAATALEHDLTVVTANRRDFDPVPGLRVDDWTAG